MASRFPRKPVLERLEFRQLLANDCSLYGVGTFELFQDEQGYLEYRGCDQQLRPTGYSESLMMSGIDLTMNSIPAFFTDPTAEMRMEIRNMRTGEVGVNDIRVGDILKVSFLGAGENGQLSARQNLQFFDGMDGNSGIKVLANEYQDSYLIQVSQEGSLRLSPKLRDIQKIERSLDQLAHSWGQSSRDFAQGLDRLVKTVDSFETTIHVSKNANRPQARDFELAISDSKSAKDTFSQFQMNNGSITVVGQYDLSSLLPHGTRTFVVSGMAFTDSSGLANAFAYSDPSVELWSVGRSFQYVAITDEGTSEIKTVTLTPRTPPLLDVTLRVVDEAGREVSEASIGQVLYLEAVSYVNSSALNQVGIHPLSFRYKFDTNVASPVGDPQVIARTLYERVKRRYVEGNEEAISYTEEFKPEVSNGSFRFEEFNTNDFQNSERILFRQKIVANQVGSLQLLIEQAQLQHRYFNPSYPSSPIVIDAMSPFPLIPVLPGTAGRYDFGYRTLPNGVVNVKAAELTVNTTARSTTSHPDSTQPSSTQPTAPQPTAPQPTAPQPTAPLATPSQSGVEPVGSSSPDVAKVSATPLQSVATGAQLLMRTGVHPELFAIPTFLSNPNAEMHMEIRNMRTSEVGGTDVRVGDVLSISFQGDGENGQRVAKQNLQFFDGMNADSGLKFLSINENRDGYLVQVIQEGAVILSPKLRKMESLVSNVSELAQLWGKKESDLTKELDRLADTADSLKMSIYVSENPNRPTARNLEFPISDSRSAKDTFIPIAKSQGMNIVGQYDLSASLPQGSRALVVGGTAFTDASGFVNYFTHALPSAMWNGGSFDYVVITNEGTSDVKTVTLTPHVPPVMDLTLRVVDETGKEISEASIGQVLYLEAVSFVNRFQAFGHGYNPLAFQYTYDANVASPVGGPESLAVTQDERLGLEQRDGKYVTTTQTIEFKPEVSSGSFQFEEFSTMDFRNSERILFRQKLIASQAGSLQLAIHQAQLQHQVGSIDPSNPGEYGVKSLPLPDGVLNVRTRDVFVRSPSRSIATYAESASESVGEGNSEVVRASVSQGKLDIDENNDQESSGEGEGRAVTALNPEFLFWASLDIEEFSPLRRRFKH